MNRQMQPKLALAVLSYLAAGIILITSGCASFQGNVLNPVGGFSPVQARKSVNVDLNFYNYYINGARTTLLAESTRSSLEKKCINRFQKSGLFGNVGRSFANSDLIVSLSVEENIEVNPIMSGLTALTLYLVPSKAQDTWHLAATITDTKTGKQAKVFLHDRITQWQQILLLPLLPFKSTIAEAAKCQNKLFDNLALEIQKSGILEP